MDKNNRFGKLSLLFSLIGILFGFIFSFLLPISFSVILSSVCYLLSILCYFKQRKIKPAKLATVGLIISILSIILCIIVNIWVFNPIYNPQVCHSSPEAGGPNVDCEDRQSWYASSIGGNTMTKSECDKIPKRFSSEKSYCYHAAASRSNNPDICGSIENIEERNDCYTQMATYLKNISICRKIPGDESSIAECQETVYFYTAGRNKNPYGCEELTESEWKDKCYDRIISYLVNNDNNVYYYAELCEKAPNQELKNRCQQSEMIYKGTRAEAAE